MEEIEFIIHPDGKVEYTIRGVKGGGCEQLSELFKSVGQTIESKSTGEYYELPPEIKTNQITGR